METPTQTPIDRIALKLEQYHYDDVLSFYRSLPLSFQIRLSHFIEIEAQKLVGSDIQQKESLKQEDIGLLFALMFRDAFNRIGKDYPWMVQTDGAQANNPLLEMSVEARIQKDLLGRSHFVPLEGIWVPTENEDVAKMLSEFTEYHLLVLECMTEHRLLETIHPELSRFSFLETQLKSTSFFKTIARITPYDQTPSLPLHRHLWLQVYWGRRKYIFENRDYINPFDISTNKLKKLIEEGVLGIVTEQALRASIDSQLLVKTIQIALGVPMLDEAKVQQFQDTIFPFSEALDRLSGQKTRVNSFVESFTHIDGINSDLVTVICNLLTELWLQPYTMAIQDSSSVHVDVGDSDESETERQIPVNALRLYSGFIPEVVSEAFENLSVQSQALLDALFFINREAIELIQNAFWQEGKEGSFGFQDVCFIKDVMKVLGVNGIPPREFFPSSLEDMHEQDQINAIRNGVSLWLRDKHFDLILRITYFFIILNHILKENPLQTIEGKICLDVVLMSDKEPGAKTGTLDVLDGIVIPKDVKVEQETLLEDLNDAHSEVQLVAIKVSFSLKENFNKATQLLIDEKRDLHEALKFIKKYYPHIKVTGAYALYLRPYGISLIPVNVSEFRHIKRSSK